MSTRWDCLSPRPKKDGGTYWHRIGMAFENEKGIGIELNSLPLPDGDGRVRFSLFEPKPKEEGKPAIDDEVPYL